MITAIEGELVAVSSGRARLRVGALTYELLIPAGDTQRLSASIGRTMEFHTLHYLEGQGQGASFTPRLIGFRSPADRAFFELFITVKGLGMRKALRALELPFGEIAAAIASRDVAVLRSLPEIGKRTADTIVAELHDRVEAFCAGTPAHTSSGGSANGSAASADPRSQIIDEATAVLTQLGEARLQARRLAERAAAADAEIDTTDALISAALRLKELP